MVKKKKEEESICKLILELFKITSFIWIPIGLVILLAIGMIIDNHIDTDNACKELGFKEATNYKFCSHEVKLECDGINVATLGKTCDYQSVCAKTDEWGDCILNKAIIKCYDDYSNISYCGC